MFSMAFALSSFFFLYMGLVALKADEKSSLNRVFFFLCLSFFLWTFFYSFLFQQAHAERVWVWFRLSSLGFCTFGGLSLHFLVLLSGRRFGLSYYLFSYVPSALFIFRSWTGSITAKDFLPSSFGWAEVLDVDSPWFASYVSHYSFCVGLGLFFLWRWMRTSIFERERRQGWIILWTGTISFLSGSVTNIVLPAWGIHFLPSIGPLLSLIWACGCFYAISRYGFLRLSPVEAVGEVMLNMRDILILTDVDGAIRFVNRALEELIGLKEEEVLKKNLSFLIPDDEVGGFVMGKKTGCLERDVDLRKKDGASIPIRLSVNPLLDKTGEPFGYAIVGHDLTAERTLLKTKEQLEEKVRERTMTLERLNRELLLEIDRRKMLEGELKESEERYRAAVENLREGIAILKGDRHVYVNRRFAQIFGYESEYELIGQPLELVVDEEDLQRVRDMALTRQAGQEALGEYEFWGRRKDGERIRVEISGARITLKGEPHSLVCLRDVTDRRKEEEKLKFMSLHDQLTGLYNRNYFEEEIARMEDGRFDPVGIIICDVDVLKIVNDTVGHSVGDRFIKDAASLIRGCFRRSDIVARIGGDEFAILLPETPGPYVERLSERIMERLEESNGKERDFPLSLSVGWAVRETPEKPISQVLKEADDMMYRRKMERREAAKLSLLEAFRREAARKDFEQSGHLERMVKISSEFCSHLNLAEDEVRRVQLLAVYHDIGKAAISDNIVFKEHPLSSEERREMERHCEIGQRIARHMDDLNSISSLILMHHERWDGKGYPLHLKAEQIPLACRVVSIVDAYEVMTAGRPCRRRMTKEEALREIARLKEQRFDPVLARLFVEFMQHSNL